METLAETIKKEIEEIMPEVVENRRYIHAHPEVGYDTKGTEELVRNSLKEYGIEILPSNTGVIGMVRGLDHSRYIAFRADMDALCLQEENEVPYKSLYPNRMHACGHDGHTAMLIGAAKLMQRHAAELPCDVMLVFQPAEEGPGVGGALLMTEDIETLGLEARPAAMVAIHVINLMPTGTIAVRYGAQMASTDDFDVKIIGLGGHAALPDLAVDSISVAAKFVTLMEAFMSRRINPLSSAVCSFGTFNGGSARNIIAESTDISGTVRCLREEDRSLILEGMDRILKGICDGYNAKYKLSTHRGLPVLVNDEATTAWAEKIIRNMIGDDATMVLPQGAMGADDFAYYGKIMPSTYIIIGSADYKRGLTVANHNPKFDFDEKAMYIGIELWCRLALGSASYE